MKKDKLVKVGQIKSHGAKGRANCGIIYVSKKLIDKYVAIFKITKKEYNKIK